MDENIRQAKVKLDALRNSVESWLDTKGFTFDPMNVLDLFHRFGAITGTLRGVDPGLFGDIPVRATPSPTIFDGREVIEAATLDMLLRDIQYCLDLIAGSAAVETPPIAVTREGVFFAGQEFDALMKVSELVHDAHAKIAIVDGYVDEKLLDVLSAKKKGVEVQILTYQATAAMKAHAAAFNRQHGGLSIRTSSVFHDRFVILDDRDYYHFGASLKDLGNRGFMFSRVEEPVVQHELASAVATEWSQATVVVSS